MSRAHTNPQKKAQVRRWNEANAERIKERRRLYRLRTRDAQRAYGAQPHIRLPRLLRTRLWRILKKRPKGVSAVGLLGCTAQEAVKHIERQFLSGMTWANWGKWHVDHIRPLSGFDLTDAAQAAAAMHVSNLRPLWAKDNIAKHAKQVFLL